jgi:hypothetical protein
MFASTLGEIMTAQDKPPYVDTQEMSGTDAHVYETVATLEYLGRQVTKRALAAAVALDDQTLDDSLAALTERGALVESESADEPVFLPARRDWSATPDRPSPRADRGRQPFTHESRFRVHGRRAQRMG